MTPTATVPRAYGANVVIVLDTSASTTSGGVHLPDTAPDYADGPRRGTVLSKGADVPDEVALDARVLVSEYLGTNYTDEAGTTYTIVPVDAILALL
ncbi:MAG: hypothetical protein KGL39_09030 [Patescibacteria group bacterium]|nr:hypothetical protein [Patescibacteria group bacterium]